MAASPSPPAQRDLRPMDWLLVVLYSVVLWSMPMFTKPVMGIHETVHCVNTREMLATGDLIIPTYGGRPWLERPPLPFWITGAFVSLTGNLDADWPYRLGSIAMGLLTVLLVVGMTARWFGRGIAVLSGLILVSMREFMIYTMNPEADIYLCAVLTLALAFFARAEFTRPLAPRDWHFFGTRDWEVLAFFVALGMLNLTKGLFFGTLIGGAIVIAYLLAQRDWHRTRRYLWCWGLVAYLLVSLPWPILAMLRCPGIVDLWESDYLGRMQGDYMRQPWWYYLVQLPWNLFPWTIPAFLGLWLARPTRQGEAGGLTYRVYTLLLAWAVAPVVGLSLANGKHHHYLLHVTAPWAIFGALGTVAIWRWGCARPLHLVRVALLGALVILPGEVVIYLLRERLPQTTWLAPTLMVAWPCLVTLVMWGGTRRQPVLAGTVVFSVLFLCDTSIGWFWDRHIHRPKVEADLAFLQRIQREVAPDAPLFLTADIAPLGSSWWLHYLGGRPQLLHHIDFLRQNTIEAPEVYLIARAHELPTIQYYGTAEVAFQSTPQEERTPQEMRWTLFRLRFHDGLQRVPPPAISPMQATGRAQGPYLNPVPNAESIFRLPNCRDSDPMLR